MSLIELLEQSEGAVLVGGTSEGVVSSAPLRSRGRGEGGRGRGREGKGTYPLSGCQEEGGGGGREGGCGRK